MMMDKSVDDHLTDPRPGPFVGADFAPPTKGCGKGFLSEVFGRCP